ncbi:MAG: ISL3 family transposase [Pseudomonadota bacterium]|nr:ISL3 family transposase [Pseudomonadota bacterium]
MSDLQVGPDLVQITLQASPVQPLLCSGCQRPGLPVHEYCRRRIRDLPMVGKAVLLHATLRRVACPDCGTRMESVSWLDRHARLTRRMADTVSTMCARLPTAHVAALFGLHWSTVRTLDRRRLETAVAALPPAEPKRLVMDEFALYKGHRYASVVLDADTRRVLWIGQGRSRAAVRPFFEALGPAGCARIEAVAMDMNTAFDLEVRRHCKRARIVYDLFHVIAKYGRDVIGRVRVDAANALRHDKPARRVVKQAHWLLLRNRNNLTTPAQQIRLDEVLAANQPLMTVYVMKEQLKALWSASTAWAWRAAWKQWIAHARQSEIPSLMHFAKCLHGYWRGIVSRVRWPMHTGQLEGINNKIKVIKRMAYGYRDSDYFFLKIKAAFPGNP